MSPRKREVEIHYYLTKSTSHYNWYDKHVSYPWNKI